ncbi:hypothetical protein RHGRI_013033 [Rhododendron griersonianum]|uniref:beta-galactosidase n=1 Tax=Rhododendron griersonianum TaxID=479676 RepID=A0AAV6K425_9ERIC|nr:hypothetical protein RHGRI_013033 [Rhododendron griersonianum]
MGAMWKMLRIERLVLLSAALFLWVCSSSVTASVTYDGKSILINGQRRILISGSIHYPRSTPEWYQSHRSSAMASEQEFWESLRSDLRKIDAVLSEMLAITRSNKEIFRCMEENLQCLEPLLGELSCEEAVMENGLATEDIDGDLPLGFEKATTFESADLTGDNDSSEIDLMSANYSVVVLPSRRSLSWCRPSAHKLGNGRTGLHLLKMKISEFSARQRKLHIVGWIVFDKMPHEDPTGWNVTIEGYAQEIQPLISRVFDDNVGIIAFGAKGSGKTYTIQATEEKQGLAALAFAEVLSMAGENQKCSSRRATKQVPYEQLREALYLYHFGLMEDTVGTWMVCGFHKVYGINDFNWELTNPVAMMGQSVNAIECFKNRLVPNMQSDAEVSEQQIGIFSLGYSSNPSFFLIQAFKAIASEPNMLNLVTATHDQKILLGRVNWAVRVVSCLYISFFLKFWDPGGLDSRYKIVLKLLMWPDLIQKAKDGGLDVIQTYVFWNGHEPSPGQYYFEGRYDLVRFIKLVQQAGLYVHLRISPFVCAEWNFGGFPVWLKYVPGIQFRTDNEPFKAAMQKFTTKIVNMMKSEKLFENQGGPIIMSQIENEYGPVEWEIGAPGKAYMKWAVDMAVGLGTGVPWIMCKQEDAPDPIIDTCNGFYCEGFTPNKNYKPKMWTEAWTGWYTEFGGPIPYRPAEDLAFSVARFIQSNGSFINYYMYHGGTNFGRTAAGLFIATSYDYDAPIDEYGLLREPKWGHLRDLHKAIKLSEPALVSAYPTVTWPGKNLEVHVFQSKTTCAAFLANYDTNSAAKITFQNAQYDLPPWSVSILPDCNNAVFNTARVSSQISQMKMTPASSGAFSWQSYSDEPVSADDSDTYAANGLLEQINVTRDASDYLWYLTDVNIQPNEGFLKNGQGPVLTVMSAGHALHVFINGQLSGSSYGALENPKLTFSNNVKLRAGINKISLLSVAVGLPNGGMHYETWNIGVLGPVTLKGLNEGTRDLTNQKWSYKVCFHDIFLLPFLLLDCMHSRTPRFCFPSTNSSTNLTFKPNLKVGLKGEGLSLNTLSGSSSVDWVEGSLLAQKQLLTWYKTTFNAPGGNDPLALDMSSMGKGQVWINGESIGRHWPGYIARGNCGSCSYAGTYNEKKCLSNCGESSQRWYHVPRSWLKPSGNFLVVLEEWGGDPTGISLVRRTSGSVCADIYEGQPTAKNWHLLASGKVDKVQPKAQLSCAQGHKISQIKCWKFIILILNFYISFGARLLQVTCISA